MFVSSSTSDNFNDISQTATFIVKKDFPNNLGLTVGSVFKYQKMSGGGSELSLIKDNSTIRMTRYSIEFNPFDYPEFFEKKGIPGLDGEKNWANFEVCFKIELDNWDNNSEHLLLQMLFVNILGIINTKQFFLEQGIRFIDIDNSIDAEAEIIKSRDYERM